MTNTRLTKDVPTKPDEPSSFRERLAAIPKADEAPLDQDWHRGAPPVVRPPAPIARPAAKVARAQESAADRYFDENNAPWPAAAEPSGLVEPGDGERAIRPRRERKRRRKWPLFLFLLLVLLVLAIVIPLFLANRTFNSIERVPVAQALVDPLPTGTNLLLVGTDSRADIDAETENSEVILGEGIAGERTDTMMILRIGEDGSSFMSLPRDLWLPIDGGDSGRINGAFGRGPDALINTIQSELGIPISHYVQVDLAGFIEVVDAVGGVDITIPNPAFDPRSGLNLPVAGTVTLDSAQALAYVRSRFYTEIIDGAEVTDLTSDLGRVQRQQTFLRAMLAKLAAERNPATLNSMSEAIGEALVLSLIHI